ncbi:MAG: phosphate ABC transporter permease PstA [Kordiimonadaceae bacterium]|nr:phosphate ABC transporter permease PstA [Kordiimonadaceae bacterium]MBO6568103.1 phosphate ABC transporter permease PstA [Kordiimonadaceae bacterium]MBO6964167.1 phosphate ABC transporter permease PstA [Kordiimonadaceae bacterium]
MPPAMQQVDWASPQMKARLNRRYWMDRLFRGLGLSAVAAATLFLIVLLGNIIQTGVSGFFQTSIEIDVSFDASILPDPALPRSEFSQAVAQVNMQRILRQALLEKFPDVKARGDVVRLTRLLSSGARSQLRSLVVRSPNIVGTTIPVQLLASDEVDQAVKGNIDVSLPEENRKLKNKEVGWLSLLQSENRVSLNFHPRFITSGDSREPELVGVWGAVVGSALTLLVTLLTAFPIGLAAAIYLEEFAPRNRLTTIIEININNLAAVPSIVFGLLGLAFFLGAVGMARSAPLVGGLTLALLSLPTIIISARAAITAVPQSIRDAARGLGASPMQVAFHHVVPQAMPGILTGTIIGMSRALGESAPLLMIGMVAFIVDVPTGIDDPATVLPVQIFLWADSPERAFIEKTSAAIMVLLFFLISMNGIAIWLRQKFERNW